MVSFKTNRKKVAPGLSAKKFGLKIWFSLILLLLIGLFLVYDASSVEAYRDLGDKYYYLKYQSLYGFIGLLICFATANFNYHKLKKIIPYIYAANLVFLLAVLIPGIGLNLQGSSRWISLGSFVFQPSETMKLVNIIYLATWLEKKPEFKKFFIISAIPSVLVVLEPDLGTAMILFFTSWLVYFLSGAPIKNIFWGLVSAGLSGIVFISLSPYRRNRVTAFFDPSQDPLGISYHINQVLIALASGGLTGLGLGQSRQKYSFLPEAPTDSIFAVLAEELGFAGSLAFLFLLLYFVFLLLRTAQHAGDKYGQTLAAGITGWLGIQMFLNLGSMLVLVPLTGVTLPFISYGGSSLLVSLMAVGIIININKTV